MTSELAKTYDPRSVEEEIYRRWIEAGVFDADPDGGGPRKFCMVIPPPNVTAALHLGHALNNTLQDVLIRWRRMQQYNTLWMPGTDHAGIATQTVVEKRILAEEGRRRTDFPRDEFVARIRQWKDEYEQRITRQLKRMGCSCDWRRQRFTMDDVCARAVRAAFFKLFADGLIYRGKRLVNWDPATQTVLADDEVEHEQVQGHFWYLRYPLTEPVKIPRGTGGQEAPAATMTHVTVATTRPETMLGDTAVAMHPADPRAKYLVGKKIRLPIVGREIPIIADEHVVLPDPGSDDEKARFSTGFLKVTPAHDPDDWAIGVRHGLPVINVLAPDGSISDRHGWTDCTAPEAQNLVGMDRFEAREAVVEFFRREKLLEDVRDYTHPVGHSYRSHVPIEPYLSDQWYVAVKRPIANCPLSIDNLKKQNLTEDRDGVTCLAGTDIPVNSLAGLALMPLLDGRLKFVPDRYAKTYQSWLENLRDWPISRQLWWGHQIPAWKGPVEQLFGAAPKIRQNVTESQLCDTRLFTICTRIQDVDVAFQTRHEGDTIYAYVCVPENHPEIEQLLENSGFTRDEDVLDTWFSSALWPFSTLGWPEEKPELRTFYPGDVLCTAREIITLWVSRMVMMGQYCAGDIPFHTVFIHAMIQDGEGRKMSKSLGNGIDPLDIIDSHGADAMRFTLVSMTTQTQDVRMPVQSMTLPDGRTVNSSPKFDVGRNFANKLWNASRFVLMNLEGCPAWSDIRPGQELSDRWILSRLNAAVREATRALHEYRFNELADTLYHFLWDDFCDWYVEIAKARIVAGQSDPKAVLAHCLDVVLRLLHPVCPFITEAIWAKLNEVAPVRSPGDCQAEETLARAAWPQADAAAVNVKADGEFDLLRQIVREIRNVRTQHNVPPGRRVDAIVEAAGETAELIDANRDLLASQAQLGEASVSQKPVKAPSDAAALAVGSVKVFVLGIVDRRAELARLGKQKETLVKGIRGIEGKLDNENFIKRAPPDVVQRERQRLGELRAELNAVEKSLAALE
ncbi:MAG TPA: valine--tRNA ligase [Phycisphaerales bacterium]|nr:valine--tRNA ligase [Phycisphaerales bacterium]